MHTIREITRLATMLAGLIAPQLRLGFASATPRLRHTYALASISCEHCRSSRNIPHCAPKHVIYYFMLDVTLLVCFKEEISKRTAPNEKKVIFHQDNAQCW